MTQEQQKALDAPLAEINKEFGKVRLALDGKLERVEGIHALENIAIFCNTTIRAALTSKQAPVPKAGDKIPPLCHQVDFGTYKNSVGLMAPWGDLITVDICMIPEIKWLWNKGIRTIECCCGHGKEPPYIAVTDGNRQIMEELGYTPDPRSPSCYLAKSKGDTPTPPNVNKQLVEALDFIEEQFFKPEHKQKSITDEIAIVRKYVSLNQQLLEALRSANFTYLGGEYVACLNPDIVESCLAEAEKAGYDV